MGDIVRAHPFEFERWSYSSTACAQAQADALPIQIISRPGMPNKERKVTALSNISSCLGLGVYRSGVQEGLAGLLERVYYVKGCDGGWKRPPQPDAGFYQVLARFSRKAYYCYPVHELSVEEFLSRYKGAKLSIYLRAAEELKVFGLDLRRHTLVGAFVKDERQLRGKAPRLIRPFSPVFNLAFGVFVYPLEKCLYSAIDERYQTPTVTKGLNGSEVASALVRKWDMFADPVCLITDMSRFDQHCSVEALQFVMRLACRPLYRGGADVRTFKQLWRATMSTRGMVLCDDGVVRYKVDGTLNSGLSSTSLCGVVVVCTLLGAYCDKVGVRHQLISAGDDTNIILERSDLHKMDGLSDFCLAGGFTVKIENVVDCLERIDFCQARPVYDGTQWVMVRNPGVVTTKDLLTTKTFTRPCDRLAYMRAIADCGMALNGGIPIMQSFYAMLRRNSKGANAAVLERNGFWHLSQRMDRMEQAVSDCARISFYRAFGINVDRQIALERYYDRIVISLESGRERVDCDPFSRALLDAFQEEEQ